MNVSLTDELERWIEGRVSSGLYRSSSEVVREALRLLREREELKELQREELRMMVHEGMADYRAGRYRPFDESLVEDIEARGQRILQSRE